MGTSKEYRLGGKTYRPEELSSFVLKKFKEDAERYLEEEIEEAVISVPAYFNDMACNATKRAGNQRNYPKKRRTMQMRTDGAYDGGNGRELPRAE